MTAARLGANLKSYVRRDESPTIPVYRRLGPITTEAPTITYSATPDGTYNKSYAISGNQFPADWPVDMGQGVTSIASNFAFQSSPTNLGMQLRRFMMDGTRCAFYTNVPGGSAALQGNIIFIDGAPASLTNGAFGLANTFTTILFGSAKPRLIEILSQASIGAVYCQNPHRLWKPAPVKSARMFVVGDSFVAPIVYNGGVATDHVINGAYQQVGASLGLDDVWLDGVGGSGYVSGSPSYQHSARVQKVVDANPDIVVVHGGGANDLFNSKTVAEISTGAANYFRLLNRLLPNTKLVFVEGLTPPVGYSGFNPSYIEISQNVRREGIPNMYFVDVATTLPWLSGLGYVGATTGSGNNDLYTGNDGVHPTREGHAYIRHQVAQKLRVIIDDDGTLEGSLI